VSLRDTFMSATLKKPTTRGTMTAKAKCVLANFYPYDFGRRSSQ
jgi:hypothetical protein